MLKKYLIVITIIMVCYSCSSSPFKKVDFEEQTSSLESFSLDNNNETIDGLVLHYLKSNLDGSMQAEITIYYPSNSRSESFKIYPWSKEKKEVFLIVADYDLERFCCSNLTGNFVRDGGLLEKNAEMDFEVDNTFNTVVSGRKYASQSYGHQPTYNYNFDLTDLNTMFRYVDEDVKNFEIGIIGLANRGFVYSGIVHLNYNDENSNSQFSIYDVSGQALGDEFGTISLDAKSHLINEIRLPYPTTPPYDSFHLILMESTYMSNQEWQEYIEQKTEAILGE